MDKKQINKFDSDEIRKLLKILIKANSLKEVPRTGWVLKGVKNPESVAGHSWGVSLLGLLLAPKNLDKNKLLQMIVVHDLGEIVPGDVRWEEGEKVIGSQFKKRKKELDVMQELFQGYPKGEKYI